MHITYLNLASNKNMKNPDAYFKSTDLPHTIYEELAKGPGETQVLFNGQHLIQLTNWRKLLIIL